MAGALGDDDAGVRLAAVVALGAMGDGAAEHAPVIAARLRDVFPSCRESACAVLGSLPARAVSPHIADIILCLDDEVLDSVWLRAIRF